MHTSRIIEVIERFDLAAIKRELDRHPEPADRLAHYEHLLSHLKTSEHRQALEDLFYIIGKVGSEDLCRRWQKLPGETRQILQQRGLNLTSRMPEQLIIGYLKKTAVEDILNPPSASFIAAFCMYLSGH